NAGAADHVLDRLDLRLRKTQRGEHLAGELGAAFTRVAYSKGGVRKANSYQYQFSSSRSRTTLPWISVRRNSRPWYLKVSRSWSRPSFDTSRLQIPIDLGAMLDGVNADNFV